MICITSITRLIITKCIRQGNKKRELNWSDKTLLISLRWSGKVENANALRAPIISAGCVPLIVPLPSPLFTKLYQRLGDGLWVQVKYLKIGLTVLKYVSIYYDFRVQKLSWVSIYSGDGLCFLFDNVSKKMS